MRSNVVFFNNPNVAGDLNSPPFNLAGGHVALGAFGTFGGGSVKLQWSSDADATWFDVGPQGGVATALTVPGTTMFVAVPGRYRVAVVGTTGPALKIWFGDARDGG